MKAHEIPHARMPLSGQVEAKYALGEEVFVYHPHENTWESGRIIARKFGDSQLIYDLDVPAMNAWLCEVPESNIKKKESVR